MPKPTPAQLHQFAKDERARRKLSWERAGKAGSEQARYDDALWSNIEQMAGIAAGDPTCRTREPQWWSRPQRIIMARNAWTTACKAENSLDHSIKANLSKIADLWQLYRWLQPVGWSPYLSRETA
ncbi:hypothetical protein [Sphingobium mellinum]|uniref:hypothetical protein n=1 Tax=Sphingobium mellinum TaxID=1387166 RepID=UPI0030EF08BA